MSDFLTFRRMITPVIIQILFWLGVVVAILVGAGMLIGTRETGSRAAGLAVMIAGPFVVRIYCELFILLFRMNETLSDIRTNTQPRAAVDGEPIAT